MQTKKIVLTTIAILLALSVIAASVLPATTSTIKKGETVEFYSGRAGVSFTDSQFTGAVRLARIDDSKIKATNHPKFKHDLLSVRFTKSNGEKVTHVLGAVYVFFIVNRSEVSAWEKGELAVYVYDSWKNEWQECYSFLVNDSDGKSSLACRMRIFSTYGVAKK